MSEPYYGWAVDAVKSLHWLKEIDGCAFEADTNLRGHDPKVVDVAHVRWATSTATTAVDLCVAEIAVKVCVWISGANTSQGSKKCASV